RTVVFERGQSQDRGQFQVLFELRAVGKTLINTPVPGAYQGEEFLIVGLSRCSLAQEVNLDGPRRGQRGQRANEGILVLTWANHSDTQNTRRSIQGWRGCNVEEAGIDGVGDHPRLPSQISYGRLSILGDADHA